GHLVVRLPEQGAGLLVVPGVVLGDRVADQDGDGRVLIGRASRRAARHDENRNQREPAPRMARSHRRRAYQLGLFGSTVSTRFWPGPRASARPRWRERPG